MVVWVTCGWLWHGLDGIPKCVQDYHYSLEPCKLGFRDEEKSTQPKPNSLISQGSFKSVRESEVCCFTRHLVNYIPLARRKRSIWSYGRLLGIYVLIWIRSVKYLDSLLHTLSHPGRVRATYLSTKCTKRTDIFFTFCMAPAPASSPVHGVSFPFQ